MHMLMHSDMGWFTFISCCYYISILTNHSCALAQILAPAHATYVKGIAYI
jgi:hypothetical protein